MIRAGEVKNRGKQSISHRPYSMRKISHQLFSMRKKFASPELNAKPMRKKFAPAILNANSVRNQWEKFCISFASPILSANLVQKFLHHQFSKRTHYENFRISFAPLILNAKNFTSASHRHYSMQKISHRQFRIRHSNFASAISHVKRMRNTNGHLTAKR